MAEKSIGDKWDSKSIGCRVGEDVGRIEAPLACPTSVSRHRDGDLSLAGERMTGESLRQPAGENRAQ